MLLHNLWISTAMVGGTVFLHFVGLAALIAVLNTNLPRRMRAGTGIQKGLTILFTVFGLVIMHTLEIGHMLACISAWASFPTLRPPSISRRPPSPRWAMATSP